MDADVKAEFDEIEKLLGVGGGPAAPPAPFGRVKHELDALDEDDVAPAAARRKLGQGGRTR
jgi:hypothetical protein